MADNVHKLISQFTNGEGATLAKGEIVRAGPLNNGAVRAQADSMAHLKGTLGATGLLTLDGYPMEIATAGLAPVLCAPGLILAPGDTLWVSAVAPGGRATNVMPAFAQIVGVVKDSSHYIVDSTVVAEIGVGAGNGGGGGAATLRATYLAGAAPIDETIPIEPVRGPVVIDGAAQLANSDLLKIIFDAFATAGVLFTNSPSGGTGGPYPLAIGPFLEQVAGLLVDKQLRLTGVVGGGLHIETGALPAVRKACVDFIVPHSASIFSGALQVWVTDSGGAPTLAALFNKPASGNVGTTFPGGLSLGVGIPSFPTPYALTFNPGSTAPISSIGAARIAWNEIRNRARVTLDGSSWVDVVVVGSTLKWSGHVTYNGGDVDYVITDSGSLLAASVPSIVFAQGDDIDNYSYPMQGGFMRHLRVKAGVNTYTAPVTVTVYVDGVATALTVSIPAGSTAVAVNAGTEITIPTDHRISLVVTVPANGGELIKLGATAMFSGDAAVAF